MDNLYIISIILLTVAATMIIMLVLIPYLQKKGIKIGGIITTTADTLDLALAALEQLKPLISSNENISLVEKILRYAKAGVDAAEQLYKSSQISKEQRKRTAQEFTYIALRLVGYDITDDVIKIVDGAIEASVGLLPKTH